jgi:ectoine hydroxylase-related dioxygenase (phytanoyl-CoA dioxygenase family)
MFMNKPAHKGTVLPYHQDGGGIWGLDRNPLMTVWTALNDATRENGCMQVVPGSHKLGLLSEYGHVISQEHEQQYAPVEKYVYLEAKCGEAILLHNWLLHRSGVNHTSEPRRAFTVCYMDGETRSVREGHQFPRVFGECALTAEATAG